MHRRGAKRLSAGKRFMKNRRGAVALEYILLCAFMAIALMSAFGYFRRTLSTAVTGMSSAAAFTTSNSVKEAMDKLGR